MIRRGMRTSHDLPMSGAAPWQRALKRGLDIVAAGTGLLLCAVPLVFVWIAASVDTRRNGLFVQRRVGRDGRLFPLLKIRTMREVPGISTSVTTSRDLRITRLGKFWRRTRIDELPQLVNVLVGHMSLVGPRPDVPGFADRLSGEDRIVLSVRPGITGPATIRYRNEERLLASVPDAESFNREVIFPNKVRINRYYLEHYRIRDDLRWLLVTLLGDRFSPTEFDSISFNSTENRQDEIPTLERRAA